MTKIEQSEIAIKTKKKFEIIDITSEVENFIKNHPVSKGQIAITTQHTTTAIVLNENEERLKKDIKAHLYNLAPSEKEYLHDDIKHRKNCPPDESRNAHAHLQAIIMGASETIPIINKKLKIGTWQRILFIELDGPRERRITFNLIGTS